MPRNTSATQANHLLVLLVFLHCAHVPANACSCAPTQLACEEYNQAQAVFIGQVSAGPLGFLTRLAGSTSFTIVESFKGELDDTITLRSAVAYGFPGDCRAHFTGGERYLVYAHKWQGQMTASFCSRGGPLQEEDLGRAYQQLIEEELAFLREAKLGLAPSRIFGFVTRDPRDFGYGHEISKASEPVASVPVMLRGTSGAGRALSTATDEHGSYSFTDLPAGDYEVWVEPKFDAYPEYLRSRRKHRVTLVTGGCERVIWTALASPIPVERNRPNPRD